MAAMRADELLAAGDMEGRSMWLPILPVVKELLLVRLRGLLQ